MVILKEVISKTEVSIYHFIRLRSDGVELDSLNVSVHKSGIVENVEILDNIEGSCSVSNDGRILHCTAWESEAAAQETSEWSKHYTVRVGSWHGGRAEAERIFNNLTRCIQDTYLKFLLKNFLEAPLLFDPSLYEVWKPPPKKPQPPAPTTAPVVEPVPTHWFKRYLFRNLWTKLSLGAVGLLVFALVIARVWKISQREKITPEIQALLESDLLPVLSTLDYTFEENLTRFKKNFSNAAKLYTNPKPSKLSQKFESFLDEIYGLPKNEQIILFHAVTMRDTLLSDRQKAKALKRFHDDNLVRVIQIKDSSLINALFDYAKNQMNKKQLIEYLFLLIAEHPNTAVERQALLIYTEVVEIQKRFANQLFNAPGFSETCESRSPENFPTNKERLVCTVYLKLKRWSSDTRTNRSRNFDNLTLQILTYADAKGEIHYRDRDTRLELAQHIMLMATDTDEWMRGYKKLLSVPELPNDPDSEYAGPYRNLLQEFNEQNEKIQLISQTGQRKKDVQRMTEEIDLLQMKIDKGKSALHDMGVITYAAWESWHREAIQRKIKRAERLQSKK